MTTQQFVSPRDALDIVFANRNQAYGAYQLRRAYPIYLGRALGIGLLLISFGLALPHILNAVSNVLPAPSPLNTEITLSQPPDIDPMSPPPPPPPPLPTPPPPVAATIKFIPPTLVPDEIAENEKQMSQEEVFLAKGNVSTKTQESEGDAPPSFDNFPAPPPEVESAPPPDEDEYTPVTVNKPPTFPGGEQDLLKFLASNIQYPALARENDIQGTVVLSFVIGKDGTVSDVNILKEIGGGCGKEAVRVVQSMPRWSPGEANGQAVKVRFTLPVRFRLQ